MSIDLDPLDQRLRLDFPLLDSREPRTLTRLRREVERIRLAFDEAAGPPMLWSGIPLPAGVLPARVGKTRSCTAAPTRLAAQRIANDGCLVVSVGGTHTHFALLSRAEDGSLYGLDPAALESGPSRSGIAGSASRGRLSFPTPGSADVRGGVELIERIAASVAAGLEPLRVTPEGRRRIVAGCQEIVVSWAFACRILRRGPEVLGGLTAFSEPMGKAQDGLENDLEGRDLAVLFRDGFERYLGILGRVTIIGDTTAAIHRFLDRSAPETTRRAAVFILGTGCNFGIAEPYAVRPEGVLCGPAEEYQPERVTPGRPLRPGETLEPYFVNYEIGRLELEVTRGPYYVPSAWPLEDNVLAGAEAGWRQVSGVLGGCYGEGLPRRLLAAWRASSGSAGSPTGKVISALACGGDAAFVAAFAGGVFAPPTPEAVRRVCKTVLARSALHVALVLAAVTERLGFGLETEERESDVLILEGSGWKSPGYREAVRDNWQCLLGDRGLRVELVAEPDYNASFPGAFNLARLHA